MRKSGLMTDHEWSDEDGSAGMAGFFRRIYPSQTAQNVAADTGLPFDSVRKWVNLETRPSFSALMTLTGHYGPALLAAMYRRAPEWLDRAVRDEEIAALDRQAEVISRRRAALERADA
ncbi:MAG: hypothetical protein EA385_15215 [Salinarimonadaceae bacterium]|nr:MAG: hypothetical protein EA385_15215 [Salinarimonadaceae bacterium]